MSVGELRTASLGAITREIIRGEGMSKALFYLHS